MPDFPSAIPEAKLQEAFDHLLRLDDNPADAQARRELQHWLEESPQNRRAWDKARRVWHMGAALAGDAAAAAPLPPDRQTRRPPPDHHRPPGKGPTLLLLAACLVFSLMTALEWEHADLFTRPSQIREAVLEDGSKVVLDGGSGLDVHFSERQRNVVLRRGEALFQVSHNAARPFHVLAGGVVVTVVGTRFDVRIDDQAVTVAVDGGRVRVENRNGVEAVPLQAGQGIRVDRDTGAMTPMIVEPDAVSAWRDGKLVVENATLAQVAEVLNRHYAGRLIILDSDLAARRVTGVFDLRHPASALRAAAAPYGGHVSEWGGILGFLSGV